MLVSTRRLNSVSAYRISRFSKMRLRSTDLESRPAIPNTVIQDISKNVESQEYLLFPTVKLRSTYCQHPLLPSNSTPKHPTNKLTSPPQTPQAESIISINPNSKSISTKPKARDPATRQGPLDVMDRHILFPDLTKSGQCGYS